MSPIPTEPVLPKKEQLTFRLDRDALNLLESYYESISSTQHYVLEQALLLVFRRDRDFQNWLKTNGTTRQKKKAERAVGVAHHEYEIYLSSRPDNAVDRP